MVNNSDFRRYSYDGDAAYALKAFNRTHSSAAPEVRRPARKKLTLSPNTERKSKAQLVKEQRAARVRVAEITIVVSLVLAMLSASRAILCAVRKAIIANKETKVHIL